MALAAFSKTVLCKCNFWLISKILLNQFTWLTFLLIDWSQRKFFYFSRKIIEDKLQSQERMHIIMFILIWKRRYLHLQNQYFYFLFITFSFSGKWLLDIWIYEKFDDLIIIVVIIKKPIIIIRILYNYPRKKWMYYVK